jgi:hypothetical protein
VGLAQAPDLSGPWKRCSHDNPLKVESRFIENPIATRLSDGRFVAVYDNHQPNEIGYSFSSDGVHWGTGQHLVVQAGKGIWATEVRTPLGLVDEGNGAFTLFYTANERIDGARTDAYGVNATPGSVGVVDVRLVSSGGVSQQTGR